MKTFTRVAAMALLAVQAAHTNPQAANPQAANPQAVMQLHIADASVAAAAAGASTPLRALLQNPTSTTLQLVGASTPLAAQTQLQTYVTNAQGLVHIQRLPQLALPAAGQVVLVPGVLELQLIGLKTDLQPGLELPLTLKFDDGTTRTVRIKITN